MMTKTITLFMLTLNTSLIFANNPLPLGLNVLIIAFTITLFLATTHSSWLGLTTFIIYIGGLLVLFAYFLTIQPNLMLTLSKTLIKSTLIMTILTNIVYNSTPMFSFNKYSMPMPTIMHSPNLLMISLIGAVLLLILIVVVNLTFSTKSPLRPFT